MTAAKETRGEKAHRLAAAEVLRAASLLLKEPFMKLTLREQAIYRAARGLKNATATRAAERRDASRNVRLLAEMRKWKR